MTTNKAKKISHTEKAAILLMSLGEELAAELIHQLPVAEAKRILQTISQLGKIEDTIVTEIQKEFYELISSYRPTHTGDVALTKRILAKAFHTDDALKFLDEIRTESYSSFADAEHLDAKSLHQILEKELPQTISVILAHLSPKKAGEVIAKFSAAEQSNILFRMAALQEVNQSFIAEIDAALSQSIEALKQRSVTQIGGVDKTAALLATLNHQQREELLQKMSEKQPELAASIRAQLWTFDDLVKLQTSDIEKILRKVSASDLELALRKATDILKARVFKCMSERRAQDLKETIALAKPVALAKVDEAQRRIAAIAVQMIHDGEINDPSEEAV